MASPSRASLQGQTPTFLQGREKTPSLWSLSSGSPPHNSVFSLRLSHGETWWSLG